MESAVGAPSPELKWLSLDAHRGDLIAQVMGRGLTLHEAEDVVSECILRAAMKDDLDLDRAGGWLRTVAHHLSVDLQRRRPSARVVELLRQDAAELVEPQADIDDRLEAAWAARVVAGLPERQQRVVQQRAVGVSLNEIALSMGVEYKTVESLMSRARTTVRRALAATLSVLGAGWLLCRRTLQTTMPSIAAFAAASVVVGIWTADGRVAIPSNAAPLLRQATVVKAPVRSAVRVAPLSRSSRPAVVRPVEAGPAARSTQLIAGGNVGPVSHSAVSITRSRPKESLLDSTLRCLRDGVALDPIGIGCQ